MSGNGTDLGHVIAMLSDVLSAQGEMRTEQRVQGRRLDDVSRGLDDMTGEVAGLRQAVTEYHWGTAS